jgi:hypothetical protein
MDAAGIELADLDGLSVELDRTLLAQWVGSVSALLAPLTDALRQAFKIG